MDSGPMLAASNYIFLSAGIPEHDWTNAPFQRHEIVQAVTATTRAVIRADGSLLFGGHPLITPLVFELASEHLDDEERRPRVLLFQSTYFADSFPESVWAIRNKPWSAVVDIKKVGDGPAGLPASLAKMRNAMLAGHPAESTGEIRSTPISAAIFIGGKPGVASEYKLFRERYPGLPCFPLRRPGGMAAELAPANVPDDIAAELQDSAAYGHLANRIVRFLSRP